jgi:hypothetical protein
MNSSLTASDENLKRMLFETFGHIYSNPQFSTFQALFFSSSASLMVVVQSYSRISYLELLKNSHVSMYRMGVSGVAYVPLSYL